ncbi:MAG: extracellular solute-binding protein [Clostridia bacterium]|jgi:multiple sugar transport system substrate-binding protein|nr:extracellular solute-binding protein [Clostridia bacterium]
MTLRRAFTLFLCLLMLVLVAVGPIMLQRYRVDYNKSFEHMKNEITWRGVITVWDYPRLNTQNGTRLTWISAKIKQFEKQNPGVYIDFKELDPAGGYTLLKAAASTGAYPDVAPVGSDYYFMSEGLLEPLDEYITETDKVDFLPASLESASYEGKLYGLPWMMTGYTMLLNTALFNEKNVPIPQDGNWTYEQFAEAAKQLTYDTNRKKGPDVFGFNALMQPGDYSTYGILMSDGAEIINSGNGSYVYDGPQALSGLQKLYQLKHTYKATPENFGEATQGEVLNSFINGKTAVIAAPSWTIPYMRNLSTGSVEFATANYPTGSAKSSNAIGSNVCSFAVFEQKDENKRKMCIEFIRLLTAAEGQEELKNYGYFPVRKTGENLYQNDKEMTMIKQSLGFLKPIPRHKNWEQIDIILQSRIKAAIMGELTPEQALKDARELLQKYTE